MVQYLAVNVGVLFSIGPKDYSGMSRNILKMMIIALHKYFE